MTYYYRIAQFPQDAKRIHELNYKTFVEEIPQHRPNENGLMVDRFHNENTYVLCLKEEEIIGMIALRSTRPFSLDDKIGQIEDRLADPPKNPVEIRLLAIDSAHRTGRAFFGLMQALVNWCLKAGHDAAVISGTVRELKLYTRMGFVPFAEPVGTEEAMYIPMIIVHDTFEQGAAKRLGLPMVNLLPGPVSIAESVQQALGKEPVSHRSPAYAQLLTSTTDMLKELTGANHVQLLQGTGTLANDAVAAQLSRIAGKGLILVNGEFGRRLTDHAKRFGLSFDCSEKDWGKAFCMKQLEDQFQSHYYDWVWFVHLETSTGIVNHLERLTKLAKENGIRVAVDCASSLGTIPVNLTEVDFASSVSGKGLASYAGLSFVCHHAAIAPDDTLPRYLDLGLYGMKKGIPFTQSSNLLNALHQSLITMLESPAQHFERLHLQTKRLREGIAHLGFRLLSAETASNSNVLTIELPSNESSKKLGDDLFLNGFRVHYESEYLTERNWLQLAVMNDVGDVAVERLLDVLKHLKKCRPTCLE